MQILNDELLASFRAKRRCEWCGEYGPSGRDPHHIYGKGMGGGGQLDVAINLIALCRPCHNQVHAAIIGRNDLLHIVAKRESCSVRFIVTEIYRLRRAPKET